MTRIYIYITRIVSVGDNGCARKRKNTSRTLRNIETYNSHSCSCSCETRLSPAEIVGELLFKFRWYYGTDTEFRWIIFNANLRFLTTVTVPGSFGSNKLYYYYFFLSFFWYEYNMRIIEKNKRIKFAPNGLIIPCMT